MRDRCWNFMAAIDFKQNAIVFVQAPLSLCIFESRLNSVSPFYLSHLVHSQYQIWFVNGRFVNACTFWWIEYCHSIVWKTWQMNVQNDFISIWFWCEFLTNFQQLIQIFQFYVLLLCWRVEKQNFDISHSSIRIKHFNICIKWGGGSNWISSES